MSERLAIIGIFAIVVVSVLSVVYLDSATGNLAINAYGGGKMYGGMLKKTYQQPAVLGHAAEKQVYMDRAQAYLYDNKDKWDCSYGKEALDSDYPCVLDDNTGNYCCVIPEKPDQFAFVRYA